MNSSFNTRFPLFNCLAASLFLLAATFCSAHNGTIRGMALDSETRLGLAGANVELVETGKFTATDELGIFTFADLPSGVFTINVSYLGYAKTSLQIEVRDHETTAVKIPLSPEKIDLPAVEIQVAANANLRTINALDIQTRPVNSSQDILRLVPGLVIAQHAGGGKAEQIFLRGFDLDHGTDIQITVDGLPVNMVSHAHGQGYADLHWLIPELVREVDFAKGTYDARAGNFATAGHVNFQTANALSQSMVKIEGGQFDTWRGVAALDLLGEAAKNKNQNAYLASEYFFSNGYFDSPQQFTRFNLMGKYTGLVGDNQSLSVSFSTFKSRWDASGQVPARAVADGKIGRFGSLDDSEGGETSRQNFNLIFLKNLDGKTFLKNQVFLTRYDFELYSNFTFFLNDPVNGDQIRQRENRNILGYNGSWNRETNLGGKRLQSEIGLQLRYDEVDDIELSRTKNRRETILPLALGNVQEVNAAIYAVETLDFSHHWQLVAGLRYDRFYFAYDNVLDSLYDHRDQMKGAVSPKFNLIFAPSKALRFFFSAALGFHSNDSRVVISQAGRQILPAAFGIESGAIFKPFPRLLLNFSLWQLDLQQEFVYVGDEAIVEASGRTRRQGFDISARWQATAWLFADADFSYAHPRAKDEPEGQNFIPLAPVKTAIGGLTAQSKSGWHGSLRIRYVGDRPANEDGSLTAEGHFLTDLLAGLKKPRYEINLTIQNLFNNDFNEAQFETESRLADETASVTELHFTPGAPFFLKGSLSYFF